MIRMRIYFIVALLIAMCVVQGAAVRLSEAEKIYCERQAQKERVYNVLVNPDNAPYSFYDTDTHQMRGSMIDSLTEWAKMTGLNLRPMVMHSFTEYYVALQNGEGDMVLDFDYNLPDSAKAFGYEIMSPYISAHISRIIRRDFDDEPKRIAILEKTLLGRLVVNNFPSGTTFERFSNSHTLYNAVRNGSVDAGYLFSYTAFMLQQLDSKRIIISEPTGFMGVRYCPGIRSDLDGTFKEIMAKAIKCISEEEVRAFTLHYVMEDINSNRTFREWMSLNSGVMTLFLMTVAFLAAGVIYLLYQWLRIRNAVVDRTQKDMTLLNKIIDCVPMPIYIKNMDEEARYIVCNEAFSTVIEMPKTNVLGKLDSDLFEPELATNLRIGEKEAQKKPGELNVVRANTVDWHSVWRGHVFDKTTMAFTDSEGRSLVLGLIDDITDEQRELLFTRFKTDLIAFLVRGNDQTQILDYVAMQLLYVTDCDEVVLRMKDDTVRLWDRNGENAVLEDRCKHCRWRTIHDRFPDDEDVKVCEDICDVKDFVHPIGCSVRSILSRKINWHNSFWGMLSLHFNNETRELTEALKQLVQIAADSIVVSLEKQWSYEIMTRQEEENSLLIENTAIPVAMFDAQGKILHCNQQYLDCLGMDYKTIRNFELERHGLIPNTVVVDDDGNKIDSPLYSIIFNGKRISEGNIEFLGRLWHFHAQGTYDLNGQLQYVFEHAMDITEQVQRLRRQEVIHHGMEAMLLQSEDVNTALEKVISILVHYFGATGGYMLKLENGIPEVVASSHCDSGMLAKMSNMPPDEVKKISKYLGKRSVFFDNDLKGSPHKDDWEYVLLREYDINSIMFAHINLRKTVWGDMVLFFEDSRRRMSDDERSLLGTFQYTVEMILTRYNLLQTLQKERDTAIAAEKAKTFFFANVSHDIRTPLNAIVGFSELLNMGVENEEEKKQYLNSILFSSKALMELINDVLDLSKLESGSMEIVPEKCNVNEMAENLIKVFGVQTKQKGLDLVLNCEKLPQLMVDERRVRQIVFNLMGNAVKFTSQGSITLDISFVPENDKQGHLHIAVKDTGIGILPEDIDRIMLPFVQIKKTDQIHGTGLGLAICKQLLSKMNGRMSITSKIGEGSTFNVDMDKVEYVKEQEAPVAQPQPQVQPQMQVQELPQPQQPQPQPQPQQNAATSAEKLANMTFLLVDDVPGNLIVLNALCKKLGITHTLKANDGVAALEVLANNQVDIVLTDLWMPKMDGKGLVAEIRKTNDKLPVYVITADVDMLKGYGEFGFTGVLMKPVNVENLKNFLANLQC